MNDKSIKLLSKIEPIRALNKKFNKLGYGIMIDGRFVSNPTEEEFNRYYRVVSTQDFYKNGGGVCWDYTRAYGDVLSKLKFEVMNLFISFGTGKRNFNTHTITIVEIDNVYVWVESSWKPYVGLYLSSDFDRLVLAICKQLIHDKDMEKKEKKPYMYSVHDYYHLPPVGMKCKEALKYFMESKVVMSGELTTDNGNQFKKIKEGFYRLTDKASEYFVEEAEEDTNPIFTEASIPHTFIMKDLLEKRIFEALSDKTKREKYRRIQSDYINRNAEKLATAGPEFLIVFGDKDHREYYDLFGITKEEVVAGMGVVVKSSGASSDFKFLTQNPILHVLYYCIRYFAKTNDAKGLNSTLGIYALGIYWSTFTKYFPNGVNGAVMEYTIDNLTWKFEIKKAGTIFNVLCQSINQSFSFHRKRFAFGGDDDVCAFAQRVKNDQNSMIKKIANQYMINYRDGKAVITRSDEYEDGKIIVDDIENATTKVAIMVSNIVPQMVSNGVDTRLAMAAAKFGKISVNDCREYLLLLISDKYMKDIETLVQSVLFLFLMTEGRSANEIKSQFFFAWGYGIFKKTNSNDPNVAKINEILKRWSQESGIYERYGQTYRIGYEKAIFMYIILTIQKYA